MHKILWKSHYYLGHDYCTLYKARDGWELSGIALLLMGSEPSRLEYFVRCDNSWATTSASVIGAVGNQAIGIYVEVNEAKEWTINGQIQSELEGCLDIDLGFTPATNTLPIRRLSLQIGMSEPARAAWLKVPEFEFSVLNQTYSRTTESEYLYESRNGAYSAELPVNAVGLVTNYPELWSEEKST